MKYFKNIDTDQVFAYDETYPNDAPYIKAAITNGWEDITGSWPLQVETTTEELKLQCKAEAKQRLAETDWTEVPSVTDKNNELHLLNANEFLYYRNEVRKLVVNPTEHPAWPEKPSSQWNKK